MAQIEWDESCRILMQAAREISGALGHHEIVRPLHLLLALLINVRPLSLRLAEPEWAVVQEVISELAPPWSDLVVLSPGSQTPTTKQVLLKAIELAREGQEPVSVSHIWSGLRACEGKLVGAVLCKLGLDDEGGAGDGDGGFR